MDTNGDKIHKFCGNSDNPNSILSTGNKLSFELDSFKKSSQFLAIWEEVDANFEQQNEGDIKFEIFYSPSPLIYFNVLYF